MRKTPSIIGLLLAGVMTFYVSSVSAEDITLTTYYPSPRGVYRELRTTHDSLLAMQGGVVQVGDFSSGSAPLDAMLEVKGVGSDASSVAMAVRNVSDSHLLVIQNGGNVGIGTAAPTQRLDVDGKIRMRTETVDGDSDDTVVTKGYMKTQVGLIGTGEGGPVTFHACKKAEDASTKVCTLPVPWPSICALMYGGEFCRLSRYKGNWRLSTGSGWPNGSRTCRAVCLAVTVVEEEVPP